jgi:uncharacterized protein (TIGR02266 family)
MAERSLSKAYESEELAKAQRILLERERTIGELALRVTCLESTMGDTLETLRGREAELEELRKYLLPALSSPPPRPDASRSVRAGAPSAPTASQLEICADENDSLVLQRVSIWQRQRGECGEPSSPCELEFAEETQFFAGLGRNMAKGGLFIATYRALPIGSEVEVELELPDGAAVRAHGVVSWLRGASSELGACPGIGIEFTTVPEAALVAIERFCRVRPPLYIEF